WGSVKELVKTFSQEHNALSGNLVLMKQNKPDGFMCVSCAWAKPAKPHMFEYCENGAKATLWELTMHRAEPSFFAGHTVKSLESWSDHDLEELGRLTEPMRWDPETDRYLPVSWEDAFAEIGKELKAMDPSSVVCYASGRASLEAAYMYQLFARMLGTNNLPDSSNMCHESTSVALPESIGIPVGTVTLEDFNKTDCIIFFGQNVSTNSPRMLHDLQDASRRGVPIITFNPLREPGLVKFANPQSPAQMLTGSSTPISSQYHQVMPGGDIAAISGICKALIEADDAAKAAGRPRILDIDFIERHTHGFEAFIEAVRAYRWEDLERHSGLTRAALEATAQVYARSHAVIGIYGMGLTQHRTGVENVQMLVNLLLLRGNIGKPGAGICPVRGHSNVQGQRTVGITDKPKPDMLDRLQEQFYFSPPRQYGLSTVDACEAILGGKINAFIELGGNFIRAIPDREPMEEAWRKIRLTVQVLTKFNRSSVIHGEVSYVLPTLGRIEIDTQASGPQTVTMEDSTACIHASRGMRAPASPHLKSEIAIIAGIAKATLPPNDNVPWDKWVGDYSLIRDAIAGTYPKIFWDFNKRMWEPGGFHRPLPARERQWETNTGRANFTVPKGFSEDLGRSEGNPEILRLFTIRSDGQFNTTIYNDDDHLRGIKKTRMIVLMNVKDIDRLGFREGDRVSLITAAEDRHRQIDGLSIVAYQVPEGSCAAYYPECNVLIPLWHHAESSKVPAAKSIPVRIRRTEMSPEQLKTMDLKIGDGRGDDPVSAGEAEMTSKADLARDFAADAAAAAQVATWLAGDFARKRPFLGLGASVVTGALAVWAASGGVKRASRRMRRR
ncbi:MAG TPA: FdhF/YdeP family oxidoreductase, partial [Acetobacteraceae bacterium]|nr:FdhF/YdeP family oxidoreductase [Acetobacteraceae bacterium]